MPLETLDAKTFSAKFSELSHLEAALKDIPAGSPEQETARAAYQATARNLIDYLQTHKPALVITVTTEQPEPYIRQVAVSSPGFEQLPNGSRMLANALALLHFIQPRDEHYPDEPFAEIGAREGNLARDAVRMIPRHSPFFGGADTTYFVPGSEGSENGVLLAVQDRKTTITDEMAVTNAQALGLNFMCEVTYIGPHPNVVKARVDPRRRVPVPQDAFRAPMPAFTIYNGVRVELFTSLF